MKVFISHSADEAHIAAEVCATLEDCGNSCFIAPRDIRSGMPYAEEIANGIDNADIVLLILSEAANESPHVLREVERAVAKSKQILVYRLKKIKLTKSMEYFLKTNQWMDARRHTYADVAKAVGNLSGAVSETVPSKIKSKRGWKYAGGLTAVILLAVVLLVTIQYAGGFKGIGLLAGSEVPDLKNIQPGDTFSMGSYNEEDIYWRVLKISEDGTEAVVVSKDVITVKAFDAPDSGKYNHDGVENYDFAPDKLEGDVELQAYVQGNSSWETSNIRTWLNADSENVTYAGQAPVSAAMADDVNGYSNEKGFLCSFSDEELAVIKETVVETKGNALAETEPIVTHDRVFLLSLDELVWFEEANVSLTAVPTAAAIEKDKSTWYDDYCIGYGVEETMWWLRDPVTESASQCYLVGNGYYKENIYTWEAGVESFGIRPAMTIELK